jgi:LIM domain kinase 1
LSSILTVRASPILSPPPPNRPLPAEPDSVDRNHEFVASHHSAISAASYFTASEEASIAAATEGGSYLQVHRFTLIKLGLTTKRLVSSATGAGGKNPPTTSSSTTHGWSALDYFFFASGLLPGGGAKCDICSKRLGRKAVLECDDCGLRAHVKCGEMAPRDCGIRASSALMRITSAPHPASTAAAGPSSGGGGKARTKVQTVLPSPFSHR